RDLAASEDLDEAAFGDEPTVPQRRGVDGRAGLESCERVEVHDRVLDSERVLEAFRLRRAPGDGCLAALEAGRDGATRALALRAAARGLAALAGDASSDAVRGALRAGGWFQVVDLDRHQVTSSTVTRWGTRSTMPRISGRSGCSTVWLIRRSP